jgi:hypothetical protein
MIKKGLLAAILALSAGSAHAYTLTYDKGASSATVVGVNCTSGTAVEITQTMPGFQIYAYRLGNPNRSSPVYIGYNSSVSADTTAAGVGSEIPASGSGVYAIGYNPDTSANVKLWCIASSAIANGVRIITEVFGLK